jgi:hypothetical protein
MDIWESQPYGHLPLLCLVLDGTRLHDADGTHQKGERIHEKFLEHIGLLQDLSLNRVRIPNIL